MLYLNVFPLEFMKDKGEELIDLSILISELFSEGVFIIYIRESMLFNEEMESELSPLLLMSC